MKNFLTQQQKILMKFDSANLINGSSESEVKSDIDIDQVMVNKLNSPSQRSGLVALFTTMKLRDILETYTKQNPIPDFDLRLLKAYFDKDANTRIEKDKETLVPPENVKNPKCRMSDFFRGNFRHPTFQKSNVGYSKKFLGVISDIRHFKSRMSDIQKNFCG